MEATLQLINNLIHMDKSIKDVESYVKVIYSQASRPTKSYVVPQILT